VEIELERGIDRKIGFAHLGAVRLPVDQDLLAEISERKFARVADRCFKKCVIFFARWSGKGSFGWLDGGHLAVAEDLRNFSEEFSKPCKQRSGAYQTLTTSIKRFGKLLWQHRGNKGRLKAASQRGS
jgi:hypothetical protein